MELCPCTEISIVSSQLELLETLYLPLSRREGSQELTAASSWQPPRMLSASIHGERERAKRKELKGEGKETVQVMFITKPERNEGVRGITINNKVF